MSYDAITTAVDRRIDTLIADARVRIADSSVALEAVNEAIEAGTITPEAVATIGDLYAELHRQAVKEAAFIEVIQLELADLS